MKKEKNTKNKFSVRVLLVRFFAIILVSVGLTFLIIYTLINPIIKETGESKINETTAYAVNLAVIGAMRGSICYDDLIHIVTDSSGKITMLQANTIQINELSRKVIDLTYSNPMNTINKPLKVPIGSFSGIPLLSGVGPDVEIPTVPYGSVNCKFLSEFVSAGINQTVHKIYLSVNSIVTLVMPFAKVKVAENTEVLISESLIIGEIPNTYLMAEDKSDLLNMVG